MWRNTKQLAVSIFSSAAWWILERLHGDAIFEVVRPVIPDFIASPILSELLTWAPPVVMVGIGIFLWWRGSRRRQQTEHPETYSKAAHDHAVKVDGLGIVSINQSGGITAHTVNYGTRLEITDEICDQIMGLLDKTKPVDIFSVSDAHSVALAGDLHKKMKDRGFKIDKIGSIHGLDSEAEILHKGPIIILPKGLSQIGAGLNAIQTVFIDESKK